MAKFKDLTGNVYGRLTVISREENNAHGGSRFLCQCSCGSVCTRTGKLLTRGESQSCGCLARELSRERGLILAVGDRYGRLVVVEIMGEKRGGRIVWKCQCDCGNIICSTAHSIRTGHTRSCGCIKKEMLSIEIGDAAFHNVRRRYIHGAPRRNLEWNLSDDQVRSIVIQNCFYCDSSPSMDGAKSYWPANGSYIHNGIDRIDSARGYTMDNVVPCCTQCNMAKRLLSVDEFGKWSARLYKKFGVNYA